MKKVFFLYNANKKIYECTQCVYGRTRRMAMNMHKNKHTQRLVQVKQKQYMKYIKNQQNMCKP